MVASLRHGETELVQISGEESCARAWACWNPFSQLILVGAVLADDINESFAAREIELCTNRIIKQVVNVAGNREVRDRLAGVRVEHNEAGRLSAANEKPMIRFVQSHREVGLELFHLLLALKEGAQLAGTGQEGIFAHLEIFTQRLAQEDARELCGWYPGEEDGVFRVRIEARDGRQVLIRDAI